MSVAASLGNLAHPSILLCVASGMASGFVLRAIFRRLRDHHSQTYESLGSPSFLRRAKPFSRWFSFAWRSNHRTLGDPVLTRRIRWYRILTVATASTAGFAALAWVLPSDEPTTPTIGPDTTFVHAPMLPTGIPDYEAHLGGALSVDQNLAPRVVEAIGIYRHGEGSLLSPWPDDAAGTDCAERGGPTQALSQWIARNTAALDALRSIPQGMHFHVAAPEATRPELPAITDLVHIALALCCQALEYSLAGEHQAAQDTLLSVVHMGQALQTSAELIFIFGGEAIAGAAAEAIGAAPLDTLDAAWTRAALAELRPSPSADELVRRARLSSLKLYFELSMRSTRGRAGRHWLDEGGQEINQRCDAVLEAVHANDGETSAKLQALYESGQFELDALAIAWAWATGRLDRYIGRSIGGMVAYDCPLAASALLKADGSIRLEATLRARLQRLESGAWPASASALEAPLYSGPPARRDEVLSRYRVKDDRLLWASKPRSR